MRRTLALAGYALHANLLAPFTWTGAALVPGIALLGSLAALVQEGAWSYQPALLAVGFVLGAIFVIRSGLVEQRTGGLQDFLRTDFVSPAVHMSAAVLSLVATWLLFSAYTFIVALVLSGGDAGGAAWSAWTLSLRLGMLLPFVVMVEAAADVKTPLVVPGALYFALLFAVALFVGAPEAVELLGLDTDRAFPWRSSRPLAIRTAVSLVAGFALVLAGTAVRGRKRRGLLREAASDIGASGHGGAPGAGAP